MISDRRAGPGCGAGVAVGGVAGSLELSGMHRPEPRAFFRTRPTFGYLVSPRSRHGRTCMRLGQKRWAAMTLFVYGSRHALAFACACSHCT